MNLKEYIKSLVRKQLEEMSGTGAIGVGAGPITTPNWVAPKGQKKNAATKYAEKEGWTVTKGETTMPGDSKVRDYVSLTGKKKKKVKIYELGTTDVNTEFSVTTKDGKTIDAIYKGVRPTGELMFDPGINKGGMIFISPEEEDTKIKKVQESNYDQASKYGAESGYTKASGYTGVGRDNHVSTYYKENMNESLVSIVKEELLNEVTYHKFRNEVKFRTKNEQLHKAIREVKRKLSEIDRIVEYTSRMKQELSEGEEGIKYWKKTESNIATISEMVNHLNNKIKNLHQ
jgi:hypothetical protein